MIETQNPGAQPFELIPSDVELAEESTLLTEILYKKGYEGEIAKMDEVFKGIPINSGFSWGEKSGTMSYKWRGEGESDEAVRQRIYRLTEALGIKYPGAVHMLGVFEGEHEQIQVVDSSDLVPGQDETDVNANFIYTMDPELPIVIRPADCPITILYAKTTIQQGSRRMVGFIHSSAVSVNAGIPRQAIRYLKDVEDIDVSSVRLGITPGVSRSNYSMSPDAEIIERNWERYIDPEPGPDGRRQVDILRATILQYIQARINPMQISAYDVDTFASHQQGLSFSHRLYESSLEIENPVTPGRYMVGVQLRGES